MFSLRRRSAFRYRVSAFHAAYVFIVGFYRARSLSDRTQNGKLTPEEVNGGTFTITNLEMFGIESFTPTINSSQCAILGVGAIEEKAVVRDGHITARRMMTLSLSFDHRFLDGKCRKIPEMSKRHCIWRKILKISRHYRDEGDLGDRDGLLDRIY